MCFAALGEVLLHGHYLHQEKGVCPNDESYSQSTMKYLNVIPYRKKALVVLLTELQRNYNQNRKPTMLEAKHKNAYFSRFDPDICSSVHLCRFPTYCQ